jgi:hypothetical protein
LGLIAADGGAIVLTVSGPREPMIDIHIRISRKLVLWVFVLFVLLPFVAFIFAGGFGGHSSGGLKVGPVHTVQTP